MPLVSNHEAQEDFWPLPAAETQYQAYKQALSSAFNVHGEPAHLIGVHISHYRSTQRRPPADQPDTCE